MGKVEDGRTEDMEESLQLVEEVILLVKEELEMARLKLTSNNRD